MSCDPSHPVVLRRVALQVPSEFYDDLISAAHRIDVLEQALSEILDIPNILKNTRVEECRDIARAVLETSA